MILPEFYSLEDIDNAERIEQYAYLDDLLVCEQELITTRKALDVAVDALNYANKCIKGGCVNWETLIDKALEQINEITKGGK